MSDIKNNHSHCQNNIDQCHKRYQLFCHLSNPPDTSKQNECDQNRQNDPDYKVNGRYRIF